MSHDHHEPQQNEIAGPVVFALMMFAIVIMAIAFMAS
jgi:multisubunit Na+/H+ antiporter MnhC subunit